MNEAEFRAHAKAEGFRAPEPRTQPPNRFFPKHAHDDDLIVLILEGAMTVDYGARQDVFGPGDMCRVAPGVDHTDGFGPDGANYFFAWKSPTTGGA